MVPHLLGVPPVLPDSAEMVERKFAEATAAAPEWRAMPYEERAAVVRTQ